MPTVSVDADVEIDEFSAYELSYADEDRLLEALEIKEKREGLTRDFNTISQVHFIALALSCLNDNMLAELAYCLDDETRQKLKEKLEFYSIIKVS